MNEDFYDDLSSLQIQNENLKLEIHYLRQLLELYSTEPVLSEIVKDYTNYTRQIIKKLARYFEIVEYDPQSKKQLQDLLNTTDRLRSEIEKLLYR